MQCSQNIWTFLSEIASRWVGESPGAQLANSKTAHLLLILIAQQKPADKYACRTKMHWIK